ncbi:formimidoylglutamase [Flavobacterium aciduliphilum]|uniref:Arginase family protein n=1 Tax=Flavobacterium aciduliphilum TaxID=1101402 RepID=A0A328YEB0_9FLAO|nr:formimidoylglutamase [Flavobacterium aciduliphilum]RAR71564.1 arginase family protein [Flavobacterium aciduliphilum]
MEFDFLTPLETDLIIDIKRLSSQHLANKVVFHTEHDFPDMSQVRMAILGVLENRGDENRAGADVDLTDFRKKMYSLFPGNWSHGIADLGDIVPGNSKEDTYFAVQKVVSKLIKSNVIPIVIGGTQDITYALYRSYDVLEQMVNLVSIDAKFDFGKQSDAVSSESYLSKIILDEPNNLFNFSNIGYQTYYNSQEEIDLIEKLYFDAYRLGEVCNSLAIAEPVFRDADLVSLDINAVKSSDSGKKIDFQPNGFNGKEICALSRYAGISDKVSCFGIFNQTATEEEAVLLSQMVWYFIEGVHYRSNEYPFGSKENYTKYTVPFEEEDIVFFKSDKTDRWWIEIPFFSSASNKLKKNTLLPCSHEDYLAACNQEIPERWWKAQRKNIL